MFKNQSCRTYPPIALSVTRVAAGALAALLGAPATAQWTTDNTINLPIANSGSPEVQAKVRATSDGGCYISWLGGAGYDTMLQRLDAKGNELWAHGGIVVLDSNFSSTEDYGLAVDAEDNAYLANRDNSGSPTRARVAKVTSGGSVEWSNFVSNTAAGVNAPRIAVLSDGSVAVGWQQGAPFRLQRLGPDGSEQWSSGGIPVTPPANNYSLADLQGADDGSVIALWVRTGSFSTPRFLYAQKFDASGIAIWNGGAPVAIFDTSSVQIGYFPTFVHDGNGGAVFAWYETGGTRNVYVQHLSADGTERFPHNGLAVSVDTGHSRLTPTMGYNAATDETFVFWTEANTGQTQWGIRGQKIDGDGVRVWGDTGVEYLPLSGVQNANMRAIASGDGAMLFYNEQPSSTLMKGLGVDADGNVVWNNVPGGAFSGKSRTDVAKTTCGQVVLAWQQGPGGAEDIVAQNVLPDGSFGPAPVLLGDMNCDGITNNFDIDPFVLAIIEPATYQQTYPCCDILAGDILHDNATNNFDIDPFVLCILNSGCP